MAAAAARKWRRRVALGKVKDRREGRSGPSRRKEWKRKKKRRMTSDSNLASKRSHKKD